MFAPPPVAEFPWHGPRRAFVPPMPASLSHSSATHTVLSACAWYLVHTKPRQENTALTHLVRQGYGCYLPMLSLEKPRRGKLVIVTEPMFPGYLFVQLSSGLSAQSWAPIRSTVGVRQLVRFGSHPAKVDAGLVETLRAREQAQLGQPSPLFQPGAHVQVTSGPFAGLDAIYQTTNAERRCMILLEILSKPVAMCVDPSLLRPVQPPPTSAA